MRIAVIILLLFLSGAFSASETAFTSLSLVQKKKLEQSRRRRDKMAFKLCQNPEALMTAVLVGNNIVNIAVSSIVTAMVIDLYSNAYVALGTGILTIVVLIFGEITPKQLAMSFNFQIASLMAFPLRWVEILLFPVIWLFERISRMITSLFSSGKGSALSVDALFDVIDVAKDEGVVDSYEQDLVQRVLHFNETSVKSIMTHRTEVFSVESALTLRQAFPQIVQSGYSRIPVYSESPENIVGVLLVRDILRDIVDDKMDYVISELMVTPDYIPETMRVNELFWRFKSGKLQIAVVLDEYGGLAGVVSMEDVAEQLLGEIYDEHESGLAERIVPSKKGNGSYTVMCDVSFREFLDEFGFKVENPEEYSTVASYLLDKAGRIPESGDVIDTPLGEFVVTGIKGHRLETADFTPASVD